MDLIFLKHKNKSIACNLRILFKLPCKTDDFPKLDLECFMKPFRNEIQIMSLEITDLCKFYFEIIDLNNDKYYKQKRPGKI